MWPLAATTSRSPVSVSLPVVEPDSPTGVVLGNELTTRPKKLAVYVTRCGMNTPPPHIPLRNQWRIPKELALHVACRDRVCVYCGNEFAPIGPTGRRRASWEHIINDVELVTAENIAVCCVGCNASKGTKSLKDWLQSVYCARQNINESTLAPVARAALYRQL